MANDKRPDQPLTNVSLESLRDDNARHLMDTVDRLRQEGLSGVIQLPQIVTVGDQSSGKSSVLEAISGIPFPRKENLCTRFATEIILRRHPTETVSVKITPDKLRPENERARLSKLILKLDDFSKLGELMETAMDAMGLTQDDADSGPRAFSRDVLTIEVSGPTRPQLTLVDLPGLNHSANKDQSDEDVKLISKLVEEYIKEERTIVLAVVSAKNDLANQIVLSKARELNAAERTLGVITKVDYLDPDTENEQTWVGLARNQNVYLRLGWHMLRNRSPKEMNLSLKERDTKEANFFSVGVYRNLDHSRLGIDTLRSRLSTLLHNHLTEELPKLQKEIQEKLKKTKASLDALGRGCSNAAEQKQYLMEVGGDFAAIGGAAVSGNYDEKEFFSNVNLEKPVADPDNIARLRSVVQDVNLQFASLMRKHGSKFLITGAPPELKELQQMGDDTKADEKYADTLKTFALPDRDEQTHEAAVLWAQKILQRSRGRELPGNFNPMLINQLFREQSVHWWGLATQHTDRVANICAKFVEVLLRELTAFDVYDKLNNHLVEPALEARKEAAHEELANIIKDKDGHAITYNHYYTTTIQKMRQQKQKSQLKKLLDQNTDWTLGPDGDNGDYNRIDRNKLEGQWDEATVTQDQDQFGAEDALLCHMAYYKDELKYFINCVSKQAIERHLVFGLADDIISIVQFGAMSDENVKLLAAEPAAIAQEREQLHKTKEMLEQGMKLFRSALGGF